MSAHKNHCSTRFLLWLSWQRWHVSGQVSSCAQRPLKKSSMGLTCHFTVVSPRRTAPSSACQAAGCSALHFHWKRLISHWSSLTMWNDLKTCQAGTYCGAKSSALTPGLLSVYRGLKPLKSYCMISFILTLYKTFILLFSFHGCTVYCLSKL